MRYAHENDPVASDANFVLFGGLEDEQAVWRGLLERGVLVRDVGIRHHLRVTAGTTEETAAFLGALAEVLAAGEDAGPADAGPQDAAATDEEQS